MLKEINTYIESSSTLPSCQWKNFLSKYQKGIASKKQNKERQEDFIILDFDTILLMEILIK